MKRKIETILLIVSAGKQHLLSKDKVLVGRADNCDIILDHPSVSHYHAMIEYAKGGGFTIIDLGSINGTFINGLKTDKSFLSSDDTLTIGKMHIELQEDFCEDFVFTDADTIQEIVEEKIYIPERAAENQILIDDEYCDIIFDESNTITVNAVPVTNFAIASDDFVEVEEREQTYDILEKVDGLAIQVTTVTNGSILDQFHIKLQDSTIYAGGKSGTNQIPIDVFDMDAKYPFITISGANIQIHPLEGMTGLTSDRALGEKDIIIQSAKDYQIFVELIPAPSKLKYISQLQKEKEFYKEAAKHFSAIFVPMLLLLLIDFTIEKPKKKLSIVYRKPMQSDNSKVVASQTPDKTQENTGHKKTQQDNSKLEFSKSGQKQQSQPKAVAQTEQQAAPAKKSETKAQTPVKAYEFKMNTNNLFASSNSNVSANKASTQSALTGANNMAVANTKVTGTASGDVGQMGQDSRGRGPASYGTKGLSGTAGTDTAYIEPKTVVLGSMDPELLRKILREYLPQFRHCYQQELVNNSDKIKGIVDLNFEITANGKVSKIDVKAKDSRFSRRGTDCMAQVLSVIDFPRPKGGGRVAVRQPLNFFAEKERS